MSQGSLSGEETLGWAGKWDLRQGSRLDEIRLVVLYFKSTLESVDIQKIVLNPVKIQLI